MHLTVFGINHNTAAIDIREKIAFQTNELSIALTQICQLPNISEAFILSTCNRTEIYCAGQDNTIHGLLKWLYQYKKLPSGILDHTTYHHQNDQTITHMIRVASGLDSMVLGETQIFGQLKTAIKIARTQGFIKQHLSPLVQFVFRITKHIRSQTNIGQKPVSVAYASVWMAKRIFSDLITNHALLIGAGDTIKRVSLHLHDQGIRHITLANRTQANAEKLAKPINAKVVTLNDLQQSLIEADIIISSTASTQPILTTTVIKQSLALRQHRPLFIVDLAVPRDIESSVSKLPDVYLYTLDDLKDIIEQNVQSRRQAAQAAEKLISQALIQYHDEQAKHAANNTIKQFRTHIETIRDQCLLQAEKKIINQHDAKDVLIQFAHSLTQKIMHQPTEQLKKTVTDQPIDATTFLQQLFQIPKKSD